MTPTSPLLHRTPTRYFTPAHNPVASSFARRYRDAQKTIGGLCPIEAGLIGCLADNECAHGALPTDHGIACACWVVTP